MNAPLATPLSAIALPAGILLAALLAGCASNPVTGRQNFVLLSEQGEIDLGKKGDADIRKRYPAYANPALQAYVQRIGKALAARSHRAGLNYRFAVLDSPEVNAFALPGGYVYVTRGILAYVNSEAELAAVLGHEIGHITARHSVRQYSTAVAAGFGYALGAIIVPDLANEAGRSVFNALGTSLLRGYGRRHELEADRLGAEYLARAGYDPQAMIGVLKILKNQEIFETQRARTQGRPPRVYHGVFSTHPSNDQRLQEVVGEAQRFRTADANRIGRASYLAQLDGLIFGDSPRQGIRRGRYFYHTGLDFKLAFPGNWHIDNRPRYIQATARNADAVLLVLLLERKKALPVRRFITEGLGLRHLTQGQALRIGEQESYTAISAMKGPFGRRPTRITVIYHRDKALVLLGVAKKAGYDHAFLATARSFGRLGAADRAKARPLAIRIARARPGDRFAALARRSKIPDFAEARLRLINNLYPVGEPRAGQRVKLIQ